MHTEHVEIPLYEIYTNLGAQDALLMLYGGVFTLLIVALFWDY